MDEEILAVLKDIRGEAKQTNARLESLEATTNTRFESLEGRVDFLEKRVTRGFEGLTTQLNEVNHRQAESEVRLATAVLSFGDLLREVRELLATKLDDHNMVISHEERIRSLESRLHAD